MSNLIQAAEMALEYFEDAHGLEDEEVAIKEALRQALTPEVTPEVTPNVNNLYTKNDTTAGVLHKKWVGLTDEEIQAERHKLDPTAGWTYDEAKLKEKNSP
jgi:hypothetical protein